MTAYQRGNRDGLLGAAAEFDRTASACEQEAERLRPAAERGRPAIAATMFHRNLRDAEISLGVAARLRRLAEALPNDPEDPE